MGVRLRFIVGLVAAVLCFAGAARAEAPRGSKPPDAGEGSAKAEGLVHIDWQMLTAAIQGGRDNGYTLTCGAAGVSSFTLTLRGAGNRPVLTKTVPCPKGESRGGVELKLPGKGPYTASAAVAGRPKLRSENVHGVEPGAWATVRIYANGCDEVCNK